MARKRRNRIFQFGPLGMDTNLLVVLFFIMVFGFIMIYSASYYKAGMSSAFNNDSMYFLKRQVVFSMVGVLVMLVVAGVNYHWICRFAGVGTAGASTGTGGRACQNIDDRLYGNIADSKWKTH